ncbi:hypothetical protein D3C84_456840 [compost metagenome]
MAAAVGEARADAGEVDWSPDEGLAHGCAIATKVGGSALSVDIADGREGLATVDEARGEDFPTADLLAVDHLLFVDHFELVAFADIEGEVDVVAEDVGQVHGQIMGQTGAFGGEEQRTVDHTTGVGRAQVRLDQVTLERITLGSLLDVDALEAAQLGADLLQLTARGQLELEALADLEAAELFGVLAAVQDVVQVVAGQADLGEHRGQGIAIAHGHSLEAGIGRFLDGSEIGRLVFLLIRVFFGAVLAFGWVLDLGKWRDTLIPVD